MSLALVATMFASVSSAQAKTAVCVFDGLSGQLTPPIESIQEDLTTPTTPLDIERGGYNFSGSAAVCAGTFPGNVATGVSITSGGSYDNIYCGTGFAHDLDGSDTNVGAPVSAGIDEDGKRVGYEIPFVGGTGPLLIGPNGKPPLAGATDLLPPDPGNNPANHADAHNPVQSGYTGAGVVNIVPEMPGNCVTTAVDQFHVAGFFVATDGTP